MPKTALVAGGAGFVGSHLSERLLAEGWRVVAVPGLVPDEVFFAHLAARRFPEGAGRKTARPRGFCGALGGVFFVTGLSAAGLPRQAASAAPSHSDFITALAPLLCR